MLLSPFTEGETKAQREVKQLAPQDREGMGHSLGTHADSAPQDCLPQKGNGKCA